MALLQRRMLSQLFGQAQEVHHDRSKRPDKEMQTRKRTSCEESNFHHEQMDERLCNGARSFFMWPIDAQSKLSVPGVLF